MQDQEGWDQERGNQQQRKMRHRGGGQSSEQLRGKQWNDGADADGDNKVEDAEEIPEDETSFRGKTGASRESCQHERCGYTDGHITESGRPSKDAGQYLVGVQGRSQSRPIARPEARR